MPRLIVAQPAVLDTLGFGPGITVIIGVALIITCKLSKQKQISNTWDAYPTGSDYVIGVFKRNHPEVYTVAE